MSVIGQPMDRTDGVLKVTGQARYCGDNSEAKLAHAVLITSTVAKAASRRSTRAARSPCPACSS